MNYCVFHQTTCILLISVAYKRLFLFISDLKSVFLITMSSHIKLGIKILYKSEATKRVSG